MKQKTTLEQDSLESARYVRRFLLFAALDKDKSQIQNSYKLYRLFAMQRAALEQQQKRQGKHIIVTTKP